MKSDPQLTRHGPILILQPVSYYVLGIPVCHSQGHRANQPGLHAQWPLARDWPVLWPRPQPHDDHVALHRKGVSAADLDHTSFSFWQDERWLEVGCLKPEAGAQVAVIFVFPEHAGCAVLDGRLLTF